MKVCMASFKAPIKIDSDIDKYELNVWQTIIFHTECFPLQMKNQLQNGCSITYTFTERQNLVCTF